MVGRRQALVVALCCVASVALAEPTGAELLARGIRALEKREYQAAEKQFETALAHGGLTRAQTLTAYIDLGAALASLGKTNAAERAFEQAAIIDPKFVVPPHSGKKANALAEKARKTQSGVGPYHFDFEAPDDVKQGEPFDVHVTVPDHQVDLVSLVRISARDAPGKKFETIEPSAAKVDAQVSADATSGDSVTVRFELLDTHENRLATQEKSITVTPSAETSDLRRQTSGSGSGSASEPEARRLKPEVSDEDESESAEDTGAWSIPHGSKKYVAVRAEHAPTIDGQLDDPIWQKAPKDDRFLSTRSKPFGKATAEPTTVQIAYDEQNLYVAFQCHYSKPHEPSDDYAADEHELFDQSEYVAVIVDALHGHTGGYEFAVSPAGVRADAELSNMGTDQNLDWHGIWDADTQLTDDGWTAELKIPWGSMYMPSNDGAFDIGINFERHEPISGEISLWALHPPATELYDLNFFGHVEGLERVHPGQRLLLLPYAAAAFDSTTPMALSRLSDLTGSGAQARVYAGAYVRLRPPGPFRLDATINPDFSAVSPGRAAANFDRFELEYPEARAFFAEDALRFSFGGARYLYGDLGAQMFYSRRLGIETDRSGFTSIVPILWGVKSVLRDGGTEAAVMNVETIKPQSTFAFNDNATVGRVSETFEGQRLGAIVLACGTCGEGTDAMGNPTAVQYTAVGGDAQLSMMERHLIISGFGTATRTGDATSGAGEGTVSWRSEDFYAKGSLLDTGKDFQAPLGFFETTGVRAETVAAGYTPVIRRDHVQQLFLEGQFSNVADRDSDALVYRRSTIAGSLQTYEAAELAVSVMPATEVVAQPFAIGANKIMVPAGRYHVLETNLQLLSPPGRTFVFGITYTGGDLFDGSRNAPGATIGLNLGRLTTRASYTLYLLKFADQNLSFTGHDASLTASFSYSPLARTAVVREMDTVAARASALVATTIQFGTLSALTLALRGSSGTTFETAAMGMMLDTFDAGALSAILSLQLGASPF